MTKRRSRGDGGLSWDEARQRWIASATVGYDGRGKRIVRRGAGRTKTEAMQKLREVRRDHEDGLTVTRDGYTVAQAVEDWLAHGLVRQSEQTRTTCRHLCRSHILPHLGSRKLRDLTAQEVDRWLAQLSATLATSTVTRVRSCLNRAVRRAMARDKVRRNVVELSQVPRGTDGRPSKALTAAAADAVLRLTTPHRMHAYIVLSLLTGARTEELRALMWRHVHLDGDPRTSPPLPPYVEVWRSVRAGGDTKTSRSRRTLALPSRAVEALRLQRVHQARDRLALGDRWEDHGLVFTTATGSRMDAANVRRDFRAALQLVPDLDPDVWTPRELRHSFVSLLSDGGVPIEEISRLVGHSGTTVTELVYRHQIRPVVQTGAQVMDRIFGGGGGDA